MMLLNLSTTSFNNGPSSGAPPIPPRAFESKQFTNNDLIGFVHYTISLFRPNLIFVLVSFELYIHVCYIGMEYKSGVYSTQIRPKGLFFGLQNVKYGRISTG